MKTIVTFIFGLISLAVSGQNYVRDVTFGTDGAKYYQGRAFSPEKIIQLNGYYYLIGNNTIAKIDDSGNFIPSFGVNGVLPFLYGEDFRIKSVQVRDNAIYLAGSIALPNTFSNYDILVVKMNENGTFDTSFGVNGYRRIDWGGYENLSSFAFEPDGSLYCVGSKYPHGAIYFKLDPDGNIDNTFDTNGYKVFKPDYMSTSGYFITTYNGGYLMLSTARQANTNFLFFAMTMIDSNGIVDTNFGTNGIKYIEVDSFESIRSNTQLFDNKLYLDYSVSFGTNNSVGYIKIYDLSTDQAVFNSYIYDISFFQAEPDGFYSTGYNVYCGGGFGEYDCFNGFRLKRRTLSGSPDPTFQNNTDYNYDFPMGGNPFAMSNCESSCFIKDESGKILIAGYIHKQGFGNGFAMVRITDAALSVTENQYQNATIYPNPFEDKLNINLDTPIKSIEIYDLAGRNISQPRFENEQNTSVDLSNLQTGTYLAKITNQSNQVFTKKIIKK